MIKTHLSLVLVDGFFAISMTMNKEDQCKISHNPYFNRWFSAMSTRGL